MEERTGGNVRNLQKTLFHSFSGSAAKTRLAVVLGIAAMVLILLSELFSSGGGNASEVRSSAAQTSVDYQEAMEQRLEELIQQMQGAGKTTVMLTLETGEEMIYALDTQSGQMQSQETHILLEDGTALTETICLPQVRGVAVLCEGGNDVRVAARITELLGALLDLPSNRICVEQRTS